MLFFSLDSYTLMLFLGWAIAGLVFYFAYGMRKSALANGNAEAPAQA
jgi:APA family basic amino acid/polyamine antiporter